MVEVEIVINTGIGSYKKDIRNNTDLIELLIEIKSKYALEDNEWVFGKNRRD